MKLMDYLLSKTKYESVERFEDGSIRVLGKKARPEDFPYYSDVHYASGTPLLDDAYMIRCFEHNGLDGEKCLDEAYACGVIRRMKKEE